MTTELGKVSVMDRDETGRRLYTVPQAAVQLSISKRKMWDKVWSGEIATKWLDGRRLVAADELDRYVSNLPTKKPVPGVEA